MIALELKALSSAFNGLKPLHHSLSFKLEEGESLALIGPSGSGKSSLANLIMERDTLSLKHIQGSIMVGEHDIFALSLRHYHQLRAGYVGYLNQHSFLSLNPLLTMEQQLLMAFKSHQQLPAGKAHYVINEIIHQLGLERADLKKYLHQLSGGMASRFALALVHMCRPKLLIADEVTALLDDEGAEQLMTLLKNYQKEGVAILFISHDLSRAQQLAERFIMMEKGSIVEQSSFKHLFDNPGSYGTTLQQMVKAYCAFKG